jgi:spore coat protein U-like protein
LKNVQRALLAAGLIAASTGALATVITATFRVQATVNKQCTVSAVDLTFPADDPANTQNDGSTTVTVNCTKNTIYTVGLTAGTTAGATIAQRLMASGTDLMNFNLYTDAARSSIWGNTAGSWVSGTGAGMGTPQALTVYGRVAGGQTKLVAATYTETAITVSVTF